MRCLALLLLLTACAPKAEPMFDGMLKGQPWAKRYEEISRVTGQSTMTGPGIASDELWVMPNERVQEVLDNIHAAMGDRGYALTYDAVGAERRSFSYRNAQANQDASVIVKSVSFDKASVEVLIFRPNP